MLIFRRVLLVICLAVVSATGLVAAEWKPHVVRQLNGTAPQISIPAKLQIVTEPWKRVAAVPYLVYMPEKDRLLMLLNCDQGPGGKPPHFAMVMSSDDRGVTWSDLRPVHRDAEGLLVGMGLGLTYLGQGKVLAYAGELGGNRWLSQDYGVTWTDPVPVGPTPDGKTWNVWNPIFVEHDNASGAVTRLLETGYAESAPGCQQAYLRFSTDEGRTWSNGVCVPQWKGVNEVTFVQAANGDLVAACRTDMPERLKGDIDHAEGLGISISKDQGKTWSEVNKIYDWGRHHPSLVLMPNHDIVMTYVVRKGYTNTPDGFVQFGIEAVVSHDHGQTWDLDHRYLLHTWPGIQKGANAWQASSQATSSVLLPDGSILTAFGTGYRINTGARDVGLVLWQLGAAPINSDRVIRDAPFDSDTRNIIDPVAGSSKTTKSN